MKNINLELENIVKKSFLNREKENYEEEIKKRAEAYRKHVLKMDTYEHQIKYHLCAEWCQYLAGEFGC